MTPFSIPAARDTAQQLVTALIHGHRGEAVDIANDYPDPLVLSLVLGDLAAYIHYRWSKAVGLDGHNRAAAWAEMLADVEEWRLTKEAS